MGQIFFQGNNTPCNGCVICCKGDIVGLMTHEIMLYESEPHPHKKGERMLAHKKNGDCVYLSDTGCSIHGRAPLKCRTMDCRNIYERLSPREALLSGLVKVWVKGKELMGE